MKFSPKSPEELAEARLWPDGEYSAEVVKAEELTSKKGNQMLKITFRVYNGERVMMVDDYIIDTALDKLYSLCASAGQIELYYAGDVTADVLPGWGCRVKLGSERQEGYEPRNKIKAYVKPKEAKAAPAGTGKTSAQAAKAQEASVATGEDIPF
jgi:hypothetical protein